MKLGVIQGGALFGKTVLGKPLVSGGPYKGRFDAPDAKLIILPQVAEHIALFEDCCKGNYINKETFEQPISPKADSTLLITDPSHCLYYS